MPVDGGAVRRIDAAKDHVETLGEDVGGVSGHRIAEIFTALSSNTLVRPFRERPRVRWENTSRFDLAQTQGTD
jgi:hypothetical protein